MMSGSGLFAWLQTFANFANSWRVISFIIEPKKIKMPMKGHRKNNEKTSNDRSRLLTFVSYAANMTMTEGTIVDFSASFFMLTTHIYYFRLAVMDKLTQQLVEKLSPESQQMLMKDFENKKMSSTVAWIMRLF